MSTAVSLRTVGVAGAVITGRSVTWNVTVTVGPGTPDGRSDRVLVPAAVGVPVARKVTDVN
jgi:hypothetical protein